MTETLGKWAERVLGNGHVNVQHNETVDGNGDIIFNHEGEIVKKINKSRIQAVLEHAGFLVKSGEFEILNDLRSCARNKYNRKRPIQNDFSETHKLYSVVCVLGEDGLQSTINLIEDEINDRDYSMSNCMNSSLQFIAST